jgi:hypothetical protein
MADSAPQPLIYRFKPGKPLKYKLKADIKGTIPIADSITPIDIEATLTLTYIATPKTLLADGTSDVAVRVENAEAELLKIPIDLDLDGIRKALNQTITLSKNGVVKKVTGGGPLPFSVRVPGVDPTRLYTLIFPIVFQSRPVKAGDSWVFKSGLVSDEAARAKFTATVLPQQDSLNPIREDLTMSIDQKLDKDKKPVTSDVYRTRKGKIEGSGVLNFDPAAGYFRSGAINLKVNIVEDLLIEPEKPETPKHVETKVDAKVTMELQN